MSQSEIQTKVFPKVLEMKMMKTNIKLITKIKIKKILLKNNQAPHNNLLSKKRKQS